MPIENDLKKLNAKMQAILKKSEKQITRNYKKTLEGLRTQIRKLYDKYENSDGKLTLIDMSKYDRMKKLDAVIKSDLALLYAKNTNLTKATLKNIFHLTKNNTIDSLDKYKPKKVSKSLLPIKKNLDRHIDDIVNEEMAGIHWAERLKHYRNNVIYEINSGIKGALAQGKTYKQMSDILKEKLNGDVVQPMRIVRTEGARVYAKTQQASLDKISKEVSMTKKWNCSLDERVRNQHKQMHGVIVDYEEEFTLPDGLTTKMPHLSGYAHHDIHCRCFVTVDYKRDDEDTKNKELKVPDINIEKPEIENEKLKKSYDEFADILDKKSKDSMHITKMSAYHQMTEYVEDTNLKTAFMYHRKDDIIKYNSKSKYFNMYDMNYVQAHELTHRMDVLEYNSHKNEKFLKSIKNSKSKFKKNETVIKSWFAEGGKYKDDGAVSDIISGISAGKANKYLDIAHNKDYWKIKDNVALETFANLSAIDVLDSGQYTEFKAMFKELFDSYLEVVK